MTREDVARLVRTLAVEIDDAERHRLKGVLQATVEQITLDPANLFTAGSTIGSPRIAP